jgi:hypothetical protein
MPLNAFQLARLADCSSPDTLESAGARFLLGVQEDVAETVDYYTDGSTDDQRTEDSHEIANNAVPIYTHDLWLTFVDLGAYNEDLDEVCFPWGNLQDDSENYPHTALYLIAERLATALLDDITSSEDDHND